MIILTTLIVICFIILLYLLYQLFRNNKVYSIRYDWINSNDRRRYYYTYNYMFDAAKHNWYGLKYPKDSHFSPLGF